MNENEQIVETFRHITRLYNHNKFVGEKAGDNAHIYFFSTYKNFRKIQVPSKNFYVSEKTIEFRNLGDLNKKNILSIKTEKFLSNNALETIGWYPKFFIDRDQKNTFYEITDAGPSEPDFVGPVKFMVDIKEFRKRTFEQLLEIKPFSSIYRRMNQINFVERTTPSAYFLENWA
jgi:hypothetical protein